MVLPHAPGCLFERPIPADQPQPLAHLHFPSSKPMTDSSAAQDHMGPGRGITAQHPGGCPILGSRKTHKAPGLLLGLPCWPSPTARLRGPVSPEGPPGWQGRGADGTEGGVSLPGPAWPPHPPGVLGASAQPWRDWNGWNQEGTGRGPRSGQRSQQLAHHSQGPRGARRGPPD